MKTLYVMRHAKSSWDDPNQSDFERPLNQRGLNAAKFMGVVLKDRGFLPQTVISSPATRARQTVEIVIEWAEIGLTPRFDERIYEASALTIFNLIREIDDRYASAMIVGHNPGFEQLVFTLTRDGGSMPTAAVAVVELQTDRWSETSASINELREFLKPSSLMI